MPHDPFLALRNRDYRAFAAGSLASSTALQMLSLALAWEVYARTHDAMQLGYLGLARATPVLLLALPAGHAADLYDRRRMLAITQALFAVFCAALALASQAEASLWVLYLLVALTGVTRSMHGPSRNSLLPLLVTEQELHNSLTWSSGVFQLSAIGGPLLGGALIGITGKAWPAYATSAVLCVIAAATSLRLRPRKIVRTSNERYTIAGITKGAGHLWREKTVLAALALDLFAVLLGGATALMPLYAEILGVGPIGLGALKAAPYIGAFLMAIVLAYRRPSNRNGQALLLSVAGFGLATIGFGVSTSFWLSLVLLALLGGLDNISVVIRSVLVQVRTPDELRGRVSAVNSLFIEASNELGAYESGLVASWFGPVVSVVSGGVGTLVVVAGIALAWPELRRLGRLVPLDE